MNRPLYTQLLSPAERADCIATGMILKQASGMEKTAGLAELADTGTKTVLALSLLTGIPLGVAAHLVHKGVRKGNLKEREKLDKIDYYRDATKVIEDELARGQLQM